MCLAVATSAAHSSKLRSRFTCELLPMRREAGVGEDAEGRLYARAGLRGEVPVLEKVFFLKRLRRRKERPTHALMSRRKSPRKSTPTDRSKRDERAEKRAARNKVKPPPRRGTIPKKPAFEGGGAAKDPERRRDAGSSSGGWTKKGWVVGRGVAQMTFLVAVPLVVLLVRQLLAPRSAARLGGGHPGAGGGTEEDEMKSMCHAAGERIEALRLVQDLYHPDIGWSMVLLVLVAAQGVRSLLFHCGARVLIFTTISFVWCVSVSRFVDFPGMNMLLARVLTRPIVLLNELGVMAVSGSSWARIFGAPHGRLLSLLRRGPHAEYDPDDVNAEGGSFVAILVWVVVCVRPFLYELYSDIETVM